MRSTLLIAAGLLWLLTGTPAEAQQAGITPVCGTATFSAGQARPLQMDPTGVLCVTVRGTLPAFAVPPSVAQSGTWNIGTITTLPAVSITGTLPAFAATPIFNIGTAPTLTTNATIVAPIPAGTNAVGSVTNTAFGISGNLPAFAATPTVNVGTLPALPTGSNTIGSFNALPKASASVTTAGCTVGVASAQCLAAATAVSTLTIQNTSAATSLACKWGGTAILNDSGSFMLAPGQARQWGVATAGLPNNALNCIASVAATPLYVEYN